MSSLSSDNFTYSKHSLTVALPRGRVLSSSTPLIMGIVNVTPDSFFPESRAFDPERAVEQGLRMIDEGADLLDVGGESTRPGSDPVNAAAELKRVVPVISGLRRSTDRPISIDTQKAVVAEAAIEAGADIVNDVSALRTDPQMAPLAAGKEVPVVLMHMRGTPKTMQASPGYENVVEEVRLELSGFAEAAQRGGIRSDRIILDPGIGFGKRQKDNIALIRGLPRLLELGYPMLLGASRKSFIGRMLAPGGEPRPVEERLAGTLAVHLFASLLGADILRVHDVRETRDALRVFSTLLDEDIE